jgi:NADP-reducing hydrogenase subunit HndB
MPKLTLEDLEKIRKKAKESNILREDGPYRVKVTVHMGTCGIASGARKIMETLLTEIQQKNITDVLLSTSGCAGLCSHEPMMTLEFAGKSPVKYIDLTPEKTAEIMEKHIIGGNPVLEYVFAAGSERTF